jgi:hypothetical protein
MRKHRWSGIAILFQGRRLRSVGFSGLVDPGFVISASGQILEANPAGQAFLARLPSFGTQDSMGRAELAVLFRRAAAGNLEPAPLAVDGPEGRSYFEARCGQADGKGRKALILADVSVWKRALAEKELLIRLFKTEGEKSIGVCARCGSIKDEEGHWDLPDAPASKGLSNHRFSHGLCPVCLAEELGHAGMGKSAIAAALAHRVL